MRVLGLSLIVLCLSIIGCASKPVTPISYNIDQNNVFTPVNMSISAGRYVNEYEADFVNVIFDSLVESGQFSVLEEKFARWPHTVELEFKQIGKLTTTEFIGLMFSALTVLTVPTSYEMTYALDVSILYGPNVVSKKRYTHKQKVWLSLWHYGNGFKYDAANTLLDQMYKYIRENALLPTINDIRQHEKIRQTNI